MGIEKLSPAETVKAQCQNCLGLSQFNHNEIRDCKGNTCATGPCSFFPYRLGKRIPVKAFRAFCLDCMCGQPGLIPDCPSTGCKCHPYRMGHNPARQGVGGSIKQQQIGRELSFLKQESLFSHIDVSSFGQAF
jgi:hypothetical protein